MGGSFRREWAAALRESEGASYWRVLSGLWDLREFREEVARLCPSLVGGVEEGWGSGSVGGGGSGDGSGVVGRREFLKLVGAGLALAGVTGCVTEPRRSILPYSMRPPEVTPGNPVYYATTMPLDGYGIGLLVGSREGRPTKVEGNPDHPASLGAAGVYEQASILQLYDPSRARALLHEGRVRSVRDFVRSFAPESTTEFGTPGNGEGLHFLLEPTSSPLTASLIARVREAYPAAGFTFYSPLSSSSGLDATRRVFGRALQPVYDLGAADTIVMLDADLLDDGPFRLRHAREFADRRRLEAPRAEMSRLYVAEGGFTLTGGAADQRLRVRSTEVVEVAAALLELVRGGVGGSEGQIRPLGEESGGAERRAPLLGNGWVRAAARDLVASAGMGVVVAGERQPARVHELAIAINGILGNIGRTVRYIEPVVVDAGLPTHSPVPLVEALRGGQVRRLVIVGGNPVYDMPADLEFGELITRVPERVYCGLYRNETAALCNWVLPGLHYLESWGDIRAWDGTASLIQPLIYPLYGGMTVDDILKVFLLEAATDAHQLLWESWRERKGGGGEFDDFWAESLRRGVIPGTTAPEVSVVGETAGPRIPAVGGGEEENGLGDATVQRASGADGASSSTRDGHGTSPEAAEGGLILSFRRDPKVYDGRFANNGWLQELPEPMTKQCWGNAALLSPRTASRLGVEDDDLVELRFRGGRVRLPALLVPGLAEDEVTVSLGYGRSGEEVVARGVGANAYLLRRTDAPWFGNGLEVVRVGEARGGERVVRTQERWTQEGRPIALTATLAGYRSNPDFTREHRGPQPSLYGRWEYRGEQWAMTIDLTVCTGCSACVVACQAENNIPIVGREGVARGREMHWLRIDRYMTDAGEEPRVVMQPMLCQHCEKAPCEYVCPVNATVHSSDGLNEMIYNRCVGTRFCSNNCPYKVRRFNWFNYASLRSPMEELQLNPDVTVRARGVMEKCTYCVQRIRRAGIRARVEGRELGGDEVVTACQQACPTRAIVFGSLGDPESEVSRSRRQPRLYSVLHELGTEPRTRYLAKIVNEAPATAAT